MFNHMRIFFWYSQHLVNNFPHSWPFNFWYVNTDIVRSIHCHMNVITCDISRFTLSQSCKSFRFEKGFSGTILRQNWNWFKICPFLAEIDRPDNEDWYFDVFNWNGSVVWIPLFPHVVVAVVVAEPNRMLKNYFHSTYTT